MHTVLIEHSEEDAHASQLVGLFPNWSEYVFYVTNQINIENKRKFFTNVFFNLAPPTFDLLEYINILKFGQRCFDRHLYDLAYGKGDSESPTVFNFSDTLNFVLSRNADYLTTHIPTIELWTRMLRYALNADVNMV